MKEPDDIKKKTKTPPPALPPVIAKKAKEADADDREESLKPLRRESEAEAAEIKTEKGLYKPMAAEVKFISKSNGRIPIEGDGRDSNGSALSSRDEENIARLKAVYQPKFDELRDAETPESRARRRDTQETTQALFGQ
jgi:hypothetical protein